MSDSNTIAGWVLGAGIVALGSGILFGQIFHAKEPEQEGYAIAAAEGGGGGEEEAIPLATLLASADAAKGETAFAKCTACHTIAAGGADGVGPNIHAIMGKAKAAGGFAYSSALKDMGGNWTWENMDAWLASPKRYAPGNKMSFPGISDAQERANLLAYMNSQGSSLPLPAAPAADAAAEGEAAGDAATEGQPSLDAEQVAADQAIDAQAEATE